MTCSPQNDTGPHRDVAERPGASGSPFHLLDQLTAQHARDAPLAIAVSGGSDSTALLLLAHAWARRNDRSIIAATVDHGLREAAREEAVAVAALCADLGVLHERLRWERDETARRSQAAARTARHRLLSRWALARGACGVALGHTRDDRIETFIMRAAAGSGWFGLAGPSPLAPPIEPQEDAAAPLFRPLLASGRDELRRWLLAQGAAWIDDPTNQSETYQRTRARRLARALPGSTRASIIRIMDHFGELRAAVTAGARTGAETGVTADERGRLLLRRDVALDLHETALRRLVGILVMSVSPSLRSGGGHVRSERLIRLTDRMRVAGGVGRGTTLAGVVVREGGRGWTFAPAPPPRTPRAASPIRALETACEARPDRWLRRMAVLTVDPRYDLLRRPDTHRQNGF